MYSITVADSIMIAHSLKGAVFVPAQRLHGATYVVEVELRRKALDADGIVADIGRATELLAETLAPLAYRNIDELPDFTGRNSTTEVLAQEICCRYRDGVTEGQLGGDADRATAASTVRRAEQRVG